MIESRPGRVTSRKGPRDEMRRGGGVEGWEGGEREDDAFVGNHRRRFRIQESMPRCHSELSLHLTAAERRERMIFFFCTLEGDRKKNKLKSKGGRVGGGYFYLYSFFFILLNISGAATSKAAVTPV